MTLVVSMKILAVTVVIILAMLAFTNPNETLYRAHIQERQGIVGVLGLGLADMLAKDGSKGIHRDNYGIFSKFYAGGDGILPRQELGWGIAGKFFDVEIEKKDGDQDKRRRF